MPIHPEDAAVCLAQKAFEGIGKLREDDLGRHLRPLQGGRSQRGISLYTFGIAPWLSGPTFEFSGRQEAQLFDGPLE
jgi:hypothetical protein